ncbi:DNA mismatch repair protein MutT [Chania multitudinisentens RB-25]|uniref:8-oxo-dGTP diphosphatase n=1 Tax=Chania multitudinisentens RB-25 TaxID=1441930 RepID=W0LH82_9GAMM|nr:NUDIX hydrolase [Chania multitudinisentens]AHG21744.1 DNA mismatch repair protein MutT [Chania multitudinisentens RB-25]
MVDHDFGGAKIALLYGGEVLVYLRDEKSGIPWPGCWDLPGGGREGDETPLACVQRETQEEFGIGVSAHQVLWQQRYAGIQPGYPPTWFMVGEITPAQIAAIRFGAEGQRWQMMPVGEFIQHPQGITHLRQRLAGYLERR